MMVERQEERGALPPPLVELLDGTDLAAKEGVTFHLVSVGERGWPHVALLSVGELLAASPHRLLMALWPTSRTTAGLGRSGKATLSLVHDGTAYRIELLAHRQADLTVLGMELACFAADVLAASTDAVDYAELVSGVRFRLIDPDSILPRWEATVAQLRRRAKERPDRAAPIP